MVVRLVTLAGRVVRLEPLSLDHHAHLSAVALDENIWRFNPSQVLRTPDDVRRYIELALQQQAKGESLPFATIDIASGHAVGSTRFSGFDVANRRVEIGHTWIAPRWQRSAVNTEAKYLMLRHAFETWGCIRVEFKTDSLNEKSRNAILRIGATQEGIFRNHMVTHSGRLRHSVYFSIIDAEWPEVKRDLESKLAHSTPSSA
ncbi:MAG: GNAT family N-acetyltransferase [Deltaproteobacteria bacterium]|nr:GNAT family N-acetyltransferase [Deltaproteobacteria bacterium]MBI3389528.1 GNAT family N-acetyltransferase [Deltaproteobacteria bacterium]